MGEKKRNCVIDLDKYGNSSAPVSERSRLAEIMIVPEM